MPALQYLILVMNFSCMQLNYVFITAEETKQKCFFFISQSKIKQIQQNHIFSTDFSYTFHYDHHSIELHVRAMAAHFSSLSLNKPL